MDEQRVDLGVSLLIPYRYTEDRIFRALQDAGFDDWTLAQCRVFQRVAPDGSRLTDLAEQAQMSKQSASVMVDQLERLGYVCRVPDPADGRARLIVIEQRGRRALRWRVGRCDPRTVPRTLEGGQHRRGRLRQCRSRSRRRGPSAAVDLVLIDAKRGQLAHRVIAVRGPSRGSCARSQFTQNMAPRMH